MTRKAEFVILFLGLAAIIGGVWLFIHETRDFLDYATGQVIVCALMLGGYLVGTFVTLGIEDGLK